ncbi:MAG: hypothetical protein IT168_20100 [Bryobacterales bacterium]|nr:hypothetical protein [Bryobacterales bacterium]
MQELRIADHNEVGSSCTGTLYLMPRGGNAEIVCDTCGVCVASLPRLVFDALVSRLRRCHSATGPRLNRALRTFP